MSGVHDLSQRPAPAAGRRAWYRFSDSLHFAATLLVDASSTANWRALPKSSDCGRDAGHFPGTAPTARRVFRRAAKFHKETFEVVTHPPEITLRYQVGRRCAKSASSTACPLRGRTHSPST